MKVSIPYARQRLALDLPEELDVEVLRAKPISVAVGKTADDLVCAAMASPIGSPSLQELAKGRKTATIIS